MKTCMAFQDDGFFDFERLDAYRLARLHLGHVLDLTAASSAKDHLDRAAESVLLNIAEGSLRLHYSSLFRNQSPVWVLRFPSEYWSS